MIRPLPENVNPKISAPRRCSRPAAISAARGTGRWGSGTRAGGADGAPRHGAKGGPRGRRRRAPRCGAGQTEPPGAAQTEPPGAAAASRGAAPCSGSLVQRQPRAAAASRGGGSVRRRLRAAALRAAAASRGAAPCSPSAKGAGGGPCVFHLRTVRRPAFVHPLSGPPALPFASRPLPALCPFPPPPAFPSSFPSAGAAAAAAAPPAGAELPAKSPPGLLDGIFCKIMNTSCIFLTVVL